MLITPTTKIESVNSMLSAVGEAPITNLDEDLAEAQIAVSILDEVSREVQSQGWTWNTERKRKFIISSNGEILLPVNTLKVEAVHETSGLPDRSKRFTMRDRKLFDLVNHTYVFTKDQFIDRVYGLAFPDLTESARRFITLDATTRYMTNVLGADADLQQVQQQAQRSWVQLNWEEDSMSDNNMITDEPLMSYTVERLL